MKKNNNCLDCKKIIWEGSIRCKSCFKSMKKGMIIKCIICNNKFYIKKSRINTAKYCSIKCRSVGFLGKNNPIPLGSRRLNFMALKGEYSPHWRGGKLTKECLNCKNIFKTYNHNSLYCSRKCVYSDDSFIEKLRKKHINKIISITTRIKISNAHKKSGLQPPHLRGRDNSNWRGGTSFEPYTAEFSNQLKEQIRHRDNCACQKCFKTQEEELREGNRKLSIHHIDYNKKNCDKTNLITLCNKCNSFVNSKRTYWTSHFTNLIDLLDWT